MRESHERTGAFGRRDAVRLVVAAVLILVALGVGIADDLAPVSPGYVSGTVARSAILAPRDATIANPIETAAAKQAAVQNVEPQYDFTPERATAIADYQVSQLEINLKPVDDAFNLTTTAPARQLALQNALPTSLPTLSSDDRSIILTLDPARWPVVEQAAIGALSVGEQVQIKDTALAANQASYAARNMPTGLGLSPSEQQLAEAIATPMFVANSSYSASLTEQAKAKAEADPTNNRQDAVKAGEVLVAAGQVITASDMVKITYFGLDKSRVDWGRVAAWMLLGSVVALLMLSWLWRFRPEYWVRTRTLVLIALIFVLAALAVKLPGGRSLLPYVIPTAAAGMLLTLLLDSGVGIVVVAMVAVLAGAVSGSSIEMTAYVLLGGLAGILAIRKGERQHFFLQATLAVAIAEIAVVGTFNLLGQHDTTGTLQLWGASAVSALIATVITLGSLSLVGNLFGILTGPQLLELANPSQPLLRRLLIETPGTYHHSLTVGNLAERAASSIGADPLLVRAAAYYHDVGKLGNPMAFIENQAGGENVHEQLAPEHSATILKQHVPDGMDLARRAGLPQQLIEFIPQHHGTAILGYVYGRARDAAAKPFGGESTPAGKAAADAVDQRRFRHSGPKPQSREAAILMLADGVEASVRSLSSRDEATLRAMVSQIVQERLNDGQLNECDLTIRDLDRIREAFVGQLVGMYHERIAYPQNKVVELGSRRERGAR
jgi:putative nucleotidyltransferase with HDIG domain